MQRGVAPKIGATKISVSVSLVVAYYLLLTTYKVLLTTYTYYLLLTTYTLRLTTYHLLLTLTTYHMLLTTSYYLRRAALQAIKKLVLDLEIPLPQFPT